MIHFEKKFQSYLGCKYAIAVNSGTSALHLSFVLAGIKTGDEVITSPFTWISTVNPILYCNAKPVFVDIERQTLNINPRKIEEAITDKTKAIIPVHMAGRPCDMKEIKKIASKNKIVVIEDCAHAVGAAYKGRKIGTISTLNFFSFQAIKHIACGEGGMITTNNAAYANRAKSLRLYGVDRRTWQNYHLRGFKLPQAVSLGYKYNWNDIHASIGLHQLDRIDRQLKTREQLAKAYYTGLKGLPIELLPEPEQDSRHAWYVFPVLLTIEELRVGRNQIAKTLIRKNIGVTVPFYSLHLHPYYKKRFGYKEKDFSIATDISKRILFLPISPKMSQKDLKDVINGMKTVLRFYRK